MTRKTKKRHRFPAYAYRQKPVGNQAVTPTANLLFQLVSRLGAYCRAPIRDFFPMGQVTDSDTPLPYIFRDNGASVLAIAHLDTAFGEGVPLLFTKPYAVSGALDDRLGAWVILDILPRLGVQCDVLLTTGEERGRSSAATFTVPDGKAYNWLFQFDRRDTGAVLYQYDTPELRKRLAEHGLTTYNGSFSDICSMERLGLAAINFGVGYTGEHSHSCHADLRDTADQIDCFLSFYAAYRDTRLEHTPQPATARYGYIAYDYQWGNWSRSYAYNRTNRASTDLCACCETENATCAYDQAWVCDDCYDALSALHDEASLSVRRNLSRPCAYCRSKNAKRYDESGVVFYLCDACYERMLEDSVKEEPCVICQKPALTRIDDTPLCEDCAAYWRSKGGL